MTNSIDNTMSDLTPADLTDVDGGNAVTQFCYAVGYALGSALSPGNVGNWDTYYGAGEGGAILP